MTMITQLPIATLRAALLFAADGDVRYYLNGVRVQVDAAGRAELNATDGRRLLVARLPPVLEDVQPLDVILPRASVETLLKAKGVRKAIAAELEVTGGRFILRVIEASTEVSGTLVDGSFPDVRRVVPVETSGKPALYNWQYLADCQTARHYLTGSALPPVIAYNDAGPGVVDLGDDAFAVVMPVRGDAGATVPSWFHDLGTEAPACSVEQAA